MKTSRADWEKTICDLESLHQFVVDVGGIERAKALINQATSLAEIKDQITFAERRIKARAAIDTV